MPKKTVDIDTLLGEDALELIINKKSYLVKDIAMPTFIEAAALQDNQNPEILYKVLAKIMDLTVEEIQMFGFRTVSFAIQQIHSWLFEVSGIPTVQEDVIGPEGEVAQTEHVDP